MFYKAFIIAEKFLDKLLFYLHLFNSLVHNNDIQITHEISQDIEQLTIILEIIFFSLTSFLTETTYLTGKPK